MSAWIGQELNGRFRIEERLGQGGMAEVYLARDERLEGRRVVVKHPLREADRLSTGLSDEELRKRFRNEVSRLIHLDDIPGVVPIVDQGVHEGTPFYVMRHMAGGSLADLLREGPQAPGEALAWLRPIAEALDLLHARKVLHRDVKPENLLFDRPPRGPLEPGVAPPRAHLSDFGIVKELAAQWATTGHNTAIGTPGFMAPEQFAPDAEPDGRADQYALAATLYVALTGSKPQYGTTGGSPASPVGTGRKQLVSVSRLAPHVPEACSAAVERALARDFEDRFATCTAFAEAFAAGLEAGTGSVGPTGARGAAAPTRQATARATATASAEPAHEARGRRRWPYVLLGLLAAGAGAYALVPGLRGGGAGSGAAAALPPSAAPGSAQPEPSWAAALREAEAARAKEDGEAVKAALSKPTAADIPLSKAEALTEYVRMWDAEPTLTITSPAEGADIEASADGRWRVDVKGSLATGREGDRVLVDGREVRRGAGDFSATVERVATGPDSVTISVVSGALTRKIEVRAVLLKAAMGEKGGLVIGQTIVEAAHLRAGPRVDVQPLAQLKRGTVVLVVERVGDWLALRVPAGFPVAVSGEFVTPLESGRVSVAAAQLTLRVSPPMVGRPVPSALLDLVPRGTQLDVIAREGAWYWVLAPEEVRAFLPASLVSELGPATEHGDLLARARELRSHGIAALRSARVAPSAVPAWAKTSSAQDAEALRLGVPVAYEDASTGLRFVLIPGGSVRMGSPDGETGRDSDEVPVHTVRLSAYYLSVTEVTNTQFERFVTATGHRATAEQEGKGYQLNPEKGWEEVAGASWRQPQFGGKRPSDWGQHPVVLVSWEDATAFATWAQAALPTEAQFERALRGEVADRQYPWDGTDVPPAHVGNYAGQEFKRAFPMVAGTSIDGYDDGYAGTAPVGSFEANPFGLYDVSGNVWEWCQDVYDAGFYGKPGATQPDPRNDDAGGALRVFRGGGWDVGAQSLRSANRAGASPLNRYGFLGFRLARPVTTR